MDNSPYTLLHISKASSKSISTARIYDQMNESIGNMQRKTVKTTKKTEKQSLWKMEKIQMF